MLYLISTKMSTQLTMNEKKETSVILDEEQMVEEKIDSIIQVGYDKTITEQQRFERILAILEEGLQTNGESNAPRQLKEMNVTSKELVAVAMHEKKLEGSIGTSCDCCSEDDEENNVCATCGGECMSYNTGKELHWLCESCYYGNEPATIGYCGFSCDGQCNTCGGSGGYDGSDEV